MINFSWCFTHNQAHQNVYNSNITYSLIESHGGVLFPGITLEKWLEIIRNNLEGTDRSGLPLHHLIVGKVVGSVCQVIERYFVVNTRPDCVDANSKLTWMTTPVRTLQLTSTLAVSTSGILGSLKMQTHFAKPWPRRTQIQATICADHLTTPLYCAQRRR